ncbi:winged helix-turn-helix domain-containing protein [Streptomyces smyrnaeus]|uniref:winged helix-turn-helix transcriptional regulator n=1 Tax=Streptomyces smyrnaeus TaxID=1387713 RepID=UPI0037A3EE4E
MTTALPASARRFPVPTVQPASGSQRDAPTTGADSHVGYLVYLPQHTDPAQLLNAHGVRADISRLDPRIPQAPSPGQGPPARPDSTDDAVRIDHVSRVVEVDGRELDLTYLEFGLLAHLAVHPHRVHTREGLLSVVWGYDYPGDGRTVDVHVARLRRKLGAAHRRRIVTVRRVGYKYVPGRA